MLMSTGLPRPVCAHYAHHGGIRRYSSILEAIKSGRHFPTDQVAKKTCILAALALGHLKDQLKLGNA